MLVRDSVVPGGERIKVLDFGIAKIAVENAKGQARTATGMMLGTIFYVAPEQCQSAGSVDGKADVYSLGAMLFELSTGKLPFDGENEIQIILQHVQVPAPKAIDVAPSLPLAYSDLIERMMAKDRTVRPTMLEVAAALHEIDAALNLPEPPADDPPRPKLADLPTAPLTIPQSTPQEALGFTAVQIVKDSGTAAENAAPDRKRQRSLSGVATDPSGEGYPGLDPEGNERNKPSLGPWIGAALGSLVVVFGVGYFVKQRAQPADGSPPTEVRSAVGPPSAPPAKPIRWTLRTVPPDAEVLNAADGSVIGKTPFVKNGLAPMAPLTVTLRKDGFVEQRLSLPEDRDFEQSVALAVVVPPPAPASVKVTKAKRRAEQTNAKGAQVTQPAVSAPSPPAAMPMVMPQMAVPRVTSPRLTAPEKKPSP